MRLGICTPQSGQLARPAAVRALATAAEQVGYASIWALDATAADGVSGAPTLEPVTVTAAVGAFTTRIRLGTAIAIGPWHHPLLLARSLASLDRLSEGRLTVSLDAGPSEDVYRRLEETLAALDERHPPILVQAPTHDAVPLVAARADGWDATGLPCQVVGPTWARIRDLAVAGGRDPDSLQLVVRADIALTDSPLTGQRRPYQGSAEQVAEDIDAAGRAGVGEVVLALLGNPGLDEALDGYARIAEATSLRPAA